MIRSGYEIDDIQTVLVAPLKANTSAPWTSWEVIRAWPDDLQFDKLTKPIIYVDRPAYTEDVSQQGGGAATIWECNIGLWDDNQTGGSEEIGIMQSQLLAFFRARATLHQKTFTVTLGTTTYTATKLISQGITIKSISPARTLDNDAENNNFRVEHVLTIITR